MTVAPFCWRSNLSRDASNLSLSRFAFCPIILSSSFWKKRKRNAIDRRKDGRKRNIWIFFFREVYLSIFFSFYSWYGEELRELWLCMSSKRILFEASEKKALNRDRRNIWIFFSSLKSIRFIDLFFFLFSIWKRIERIVTVHVEQKDFVRD